LQILLHVEKLHHVAEAVGVVQGRRLQAKSATQEMYASIDQVIETVAGRGFLKDKVREGIDMLLRNGEAMEPKNGIIQLI